MLCSAGRHSFRWQARFAHHGFARCGMGCTWRHVAATEVRPGARRWEHADGWSCVACVLCVTVTVSCVAHRCVASHRLWVLRTAGSMRQCTCCCWRASFCARPCKPCKCGSLCRAAVARVPCQTHPTSYCGVGVLPGCESPAMLTAVAQHCLAQAAAGHGPLVGPAGGSWSERDVVQWGWPGHRQPLAGPALLCCPCILCPVEHARLLSGCLPRVRRLWGGSLLLCAT